MCGIAGIIGGSPNSQENLTLMLDSIKHRGPDDSGVFVSNNNKVFLGSRRLSIVDLSSNGHMPMNSSDGNIVVCQNGEIYNYPQLRLLLEDKGHTFFSNSDTEVIINGYREWGTDVFSKLQGMFAISLYDKTLNKVLLARDRIGIKPVYILTHNNQIFFSSEVKAFHAIGYKLGNNINLDVADLMLGFMFTPDNVNTLVKNVEKLPPATYMEINPDTLDTKTYKYWELQKSNKPIKSFQDTVEELDALLEKTVSSHLMSDVPLGVLLSGGLDSSLLTAYVKKLSKDSKVATFNAKFAHKFDESSYARTVADYLKTDHSEILIDTKNVNAEIEKHIKNYDDLTTFDGGLITTSILCKEIKAQGITVLLLGEGADEVFGGYSWFGLSQLPFSMLPRAAQASLYYYAISRNVLFKPEKYYSEWIKVYRKNFEEDIFRNVSNTELTMQLPNHLLMKVDKGSMAASIEARVPYLDHELIEFVYSLPREYKLGGDAYNFKASSEKLILREVAKKYLPESIFTRKKRGFMLPMLDVLNADLDKVKNYVLSEGSISRELLPVKQIEDLFNLKGPKILAMQREYILWRLFLLDVWKYEFSK